MAGPDLHPVPDEPFDASDAKQVRKRERESVRREREQREVLADLLAKPAGRNWMWSVLVDCHMNTNPFEENTHNTAFRLGEMNVGQRILAAIMRVSPDAYVQMLKEQGKA